MNKQILPMTDLGRLLQGNKSGENLECLHQTLDKELSRVRQRMTKGLSKEDYVHACKRVVALNHAQMVLKSVHIYLAH
jgi:hypothetical protein